MKTHAEQTHTVLVAMSWMLNLPSTTVATLCVWERDQVCADGFACVRTCVCEFLLCVFLYASEQIQTHWITYMQWDWHTNTTGAGLVTNLAFLVSVRRIYHTGSIALGPSCRTDSDIWKQTSWFHISLGARHNIIRIIRIVAACPHTPGLHCLVSRLSRLSFKPLY